MSYYGGAVLPNPTMYAIWWGNRADFPTDAVHGLDAFLRGLDGSDYLNIARQYLFGAAAHTRFGGNFFDTSPLPTEDPFVNLAPLTNEVCSVAAQHGLQRGNASVFLIYTSGRVVPDPYAYCAFHAYDFCPDGAVVNYAYMPNDTGLWACDASDIPPFLSPNNYSQDTQALANNSAHEIMETISDPQGDGWHDANFSEIGDACAWTFLDWVPLEGSRWKVQPIWSNERNGCDQAGNRDVRVVGTTSSAGLVNKFDIPAAAYGTIPKSINSLGAVAGFYIDVSNILHGFVRTAAGIVTPFDVPGGTLGTGAYAINDSGEVAGHFGSIDAATGFVVFQGFVRDRHGRFATFDVPPGPPFVWTYSQGINADGVVAGFDLDQNSVAHGFVRDGLGNLSTFDAPGAGLLTGTLAFGINRAGVISGSTTDTNNRTHGFVRDALGNITTFDVPGGVGTTWAYGINDTGSIVGYYTDARFVKRCFVRNPNGTFITFDAPGASFGTIAQSISATGAVAGAYSDENAMSRGFVRHADGSFTTFESPIRDINVFGATAGYAFEPLQ
jgi:uncharacterized membrane protein